MTKESGPPDCDEAEIGEWGVAPYRWIPVGADFVEGDVIRWREGVWDRRGRMRKGRRVRIAEREIVAEVIADDQEGDWVYLNPLKSRVVSVKDGFGQWPIAALCEGTMIRRKRRTIVRQKEAVFRLLWSEDSVRAAIVEGRAQWGRHDDSASVDPDGPGDVEKR